MKRRSGREMSCDASHQSQGNDLSRLTATEFRCSRGTSPLPCLGKPIRSSPVRYSRSSDSTSQPCSISIFLRQPIITHFFLPPTIEVFRIE